MTTTKDRQIYESFITSTAYNRYEAVGEEFNLPCKDIAQAVVRHQESLCRRLLAKEGWA